jgi:hypothetical protein
VPAKPRVRIAHLAGPTATIQNTPPLVTSNKARRKYGLPPRKNPDGSEQRFDVVRAQRLATPATVYVERFSAHPLEADAAELYGPPDGYIDNRGVFHLLVSTLRAFGIARPGCKTSIGEMWTGARRNENRCLEPAQKRTFGAGFIRVPGTGICG